MKLINYYIYFFKLYVGIIESQVLMRAGIKFINATGMFRVVDFCAVEYISTAVRNYTFYD